MSDPARRILLVQGHSDPRGEHFCHALANAYATGARDAGHEIRTVDIAKLTFPLLRSYADNHYGEPPEDIGEVQRALTRAEHVVMLFPMWNGTAPALARGFLEQTFRPGFIFPDAKPGQRLGFAAYFAQRKALSGRTGRVIVTMNMPAAIYRWYFRPHVERNTLRLAGIAPIKETLIGRVDASTIAKRERWLRKMRTLGAEAS
jgi:putative NADPH-quinone reductase